MVRHDKIASFNVYWDGSCDITTFPGFSLLETPYEIDHAGAQWIYPLRTEISRVAKEWIAKNKELKK
jgi:hypothetical protein